MDLHFARLLNSTRTCRSSGATFSQLLSLSCDRPDICSDELVVQDNSAILSEHGDVLTDDFCRLGSLQFLRATLALPIQDSGGTEFILSTWASVSEEDFDAYLDMLDMQESESYGTRPAWLANAIPLQEGPPPMGRIRVRCDSQYPDYEIMETEHALYNLQARGLSFEELLEMLQAYGHDIPSLIYDA
ncbi:DUF2199 domain-containing protein [Epibacterium sp. SM1969]|uniref:DUF2199 domain-containing protein n=1 Tax=Tritonibacter aquimaris TaxID=2663379 RepID=A0A844AJ62_9RHOB|nr:DUF2199 domain-containing protein [Tritonibacter aquimaris]MQY41140.1 DUF2199 domain-containing protein [Tritonibacter aquimaris]